MVNDTPEPNLSARGPYAWVLGAGGLMVAITGAVILIPAAHFAYRSPTSHVAIESAACVIAALMAAMAAMRVRRACELGDLLLFVTLLTLALTNLGFSLIPSLAGAADDAFSTWAPVAGRSLGSIGFLAAAFAGSRKLVDAGRALRLAGAGTLLALLVIAAAVGLLADSLPRGVDVVTPAEQSDRPSLRTPAVILVLHLLSVLVYGLAAWGFARRARAGTTPFTWIAVAMVVAAGSRLNYFLYPSLYSDYVYFGDILRLASYLLLFGGLIVQILSYERALRELAVLRERRRMARDLHDGLAQELAFIASKAQQLAARHPRGSQEIVQAADRALLESRLAISALMRPENERMADALERVASEAVRGEATVTVDADEENDLRPDARDALLRITAEAARNAVRHGSASRVSITFANNGTAHLEVADDGSGFDAQAAPAPGRYGLGTMRDRAEALGGALRVTSGPGQGATVEVEIP